MNRNRATNIYQCFTVDRRSRYVSTEISIPADDRDFDIQTLKIQNPAVQLRSYDESRNTTSASNGSKHWRFPCNARQRAGNRRAEGLLHDRRVFPPHDCTVGIGGKIGSTSKHKATLSLPQQFRSINIRFDETTVGYLHHLECSCPEWKQEQFDSLEIQRAESHSLQSVRREYLTSPYTFKSRRRGHTPIKLRTFAKGGDRKSIGSDFSNGVSIVFVSRGTMLVPSGYRTMPFASSLTQRTARAKLRA